MHKNDLSTKAQEQNSYKKLQLEKRKKKDKILLERKQLVDECILKDALHVEDSSSKKCNLCSHWFTAQRAAKFTLLLGWKLS